jgi:hypothetical protein
MTDVVKLLSRHTKDENGCWTWTGYKNQIWYGRARYFGDLVGVHRISWMHHHGEIPDGMLVMHKCDNRLCINPEHLQLGTHGDNNRDCFEKGRHPNSAGYKARRAVAPQPEPPWQPSFPDSLDGVKFKLWLERVKEDMVSLDRYFDAKRKKA